VLPELRDEISRGEGAPTVGMEDQSRSGSQGAGFGRPGHRQAANGHFMGRFQPQNRVWTAPSRGASAGTSHDSTNGYADRSGARPGPESAHYPLFDAH
jgi:hypothetical protein